MDHFLQIDRYTEYMKTIIAEANQDHSSKMKSFESDKVKLESGISEQKKRETIMIDSERQRSCRHRKQSLTWPYVFLSRSSDGEGEDDGIDFASSNENGRHRKARDGQSQDRSGTW